MMITFAIIIQMKGYTGFNNLDLILSLSGASNIIDPRSLTNSTFGNKPHDNCLFEGSSDYPHAVEQPRPRGRSVSAGARYLRGKRTGSDPQFPFLRRNLQFI